MFSVLDSLGFAQHRLALNLSGLSHADDSVLPEKASQEEFRAVQRRRTNYA